ncbi:MAG TPA: hypothetical protein VH482_26840, partial [Thermomicrobiales bacterium]
MDDDRLDLDVPACGTGIWAEFVCRVRKLLDPGIVHPRNLDRESFSQPVPAFRIGTLRNLHDDDGLRHIVTGSTRDRGQRALVAPTPGGEELFGVRSVADSIRFRTAQLHVQDAVVADRMPLTSAPDRDRRRVL